MDLPIDLQVYLRDEAYVCLCQEAVHEQLAAMEQQKTDLLKSRSPFGVLRRKESIEEIDRSIGITTQTVAGLQDRLTRLRRHDQRLQVHVRADLTTYLTAASADFRSFVTLQELFNQWQASVTHSLRKDLADFAREMRELRQLVTEPDASPHACGLKLRKLREIAAALEQHDSDVEKIAAAIHRERMEFTAADVHVPALPPFRRLLWVDWIAVIPLEQLVGELTRVESEIAIVLRTSIDNEVALVKASHQCCVRLQENMLQTYWNQLRTHAQTYYVEALDVDSVLKVLAGRYDHANTPQVRQGVHDPRRSLA